MDKINFPGASRGHESASAPVSIAAFLALALTIGCVAAPPAAQASGHASKKHAGKPAAAKPCPELGRGIAYYNAGKYKDALPFLQYASRKTPLDWTGHYYLGHTLLLLGQKSDAVTEYRYCMGCNPQPNIVTNCQNAILGIYPQAAESTEFNAQTDNSCLMKPVKNAMSGDRQTALQWKKDRVMMEMGEEEQRINRKKAVTSQNLEKSPYVPLMDKYAGFGYSPVVDPAFSKNLTEHTNHEIDAMKQEYKKKAENVK